jgi:hypothetical protein
MESAKEIERPSAATQADDSQNLDERRLDLIREMSSSRVSEESEKICKQKSELAGIHRLQMTDPRQDTEPGQSFRIV